MTFKEADSFPLMLDFGVENSCLSHVSSVALVAPGAPHFSVGCGPCEQSKFSPLPLCAGEITALQGLYAGRCRRVSLCVFWFCLEAFCHSAAPLPLSLHVPLAAGLPKIPLCCLLPGVVLQGCSLCQRGYGHEFYSFHLMFLAPIIVCGLKGAVVWVQTTSCKDPLSNTLR